MGPVQVLLGHFWTQKWTNLEGYFTGKEKKDALFRISRALFSTQKLTPAHSPQTA